MSALINAAAAADYPAEIVLVISNRADAAGLKWLGPAGSKRCDRKQAVRE